MQVELEENPPKLKFIIHKGLRNKLKTLLNISVFYILLTLIINFSLQAIEINLLSTFFSFNTTNILQLSLLIFHYIIIIYLLWKWKTKPKLIEINTEMGDLNCKYGFYSINPESQLNLHRNWLYKEDTGPDIYRDGKKVSKAENEQIQDHVLNSETRWSIKLESYQVYEDEVQGPNHPIIDQLSEDIADTMDIPLIDHTGVETISSDPNNLNISLINKLKEEGVTPIDENDEKLNNLPIFEKNGKFVIEETSISYFNILYNIFVSIIFLTLFGISLISILQLITQNLIVTYSLPQELYYFGAIIFPHSVLGFLKRFNGIRKKHLISIDKDGVHEVQARLILNHKPWNLPLDEIEHLHIVDGPDERKLLEFIADRGRIILSNLMEEDQVIEMKSALQKIILYLGNGK